MEVFVTETINPTTIKAMVRPGKKFTPGSTVVLDEAAGLSCTVVAVEPDGLRVMELSHAINLPVYEPFRLTPLPPYISQDESLSGEYQTVYAKPLGSKAAPTAGLHFTDSLLQNIRKNHAIAEVTLHVGLGTFAPVKVDDISKHHMHSEWFTIDQTNAGIINNSRHITAVGTTSVRTLESARVHDEKLFRNLTIRQYLLRRATHLSRSTL